MDHSVPRYSSVFLRAVTVATLATALTAPVMADGGDRSFQLRDGVVVDADRGLAYVMRPGRGLDAINLENGRAEWGTEAASRPLAMSAGRLIAQSEGAPGMGLRIVSLDPETRGAVMERADVPLPAGVRGTIDDAWRTKLRVAATTAGGNTVISWKSTETLSKAAIPGPFEGQAPGVGAPAALQSAKTARIHEGTMRVDMATGQTTAVPAKNLTLNASNLRALPTKSRTEIAGREFLSADGKHILVSTRLDKAEIDAAYRWTLFDRASGERLGSLDHVSSAAPFMVVGKHIVFEAQGGVRATGLDDAPFERRNLELRAVDLLSGTQIWKVALRDVSFQGPFPP